MTVIRDAADPKCAARIVNSIATIDAILERGYFKKQLKALFGLAGLEHDQDFVSLLEVLISFALSPSTPLTKPITVSPWLLASQVLGS